MHDRAEVLTPVVEVEQRRAERVVYRDLKISYDGCTDAVAVRSPDLTAAGMFINTPRIFAKGAELRLRFDLVRTKAKVLARGRVCYCLSGVGVGVEFIGLADYARAAIEKELEQLRMKNEKVAPTECR